MKTWIPDKCYALSGMTYLPVGALLKREGVLHEQVIADAIRSYRNSVNTPV